MGGASGEALEEDRPATGDPPVWSGKELSQGKAGAMMEHRQLDLSPHGRVADPCPRGAHSLGEQEVSCQGPGGQGGFREEEG